MAPVRDISGYLDRIEGAAQALVATRQRVLELEELLYGLKKRQDETTAQLEASRKLSAELEQELASQTTRATRAEALALAAANHAKQLDRALAESNSKLEALTGAVDAAFSEQFSSSPQLKAAA